MEKISHVKNPLTMIAIFAGVSEAFAIYSLTELSEPLASIFIWFVMLFPILLVGLFFATLNFNRNALYAPSDFKEDRSYLELSVQPMSTVDTAQKFSLQSGTDKDEPEYKNTTKDNELYAQAEADNSKVETKLTLAHGKGTQNMYISKREASSILEERALRKIGETLSIDIQQNVVIRSGQKRIFLDGFARRSDGSAHLFDVVFSGISGAISFNNLKGHLNQINSAYETLDKMHLAVSIHIILVADELNTKTSRIEDLENKIHTHFNDTSRARVYIHRLDADNLSKG